MGINLGLLDVGTRLLVATAASDFELVVVDKTLIDVTANHPSFQPPRRGRLIGSSPDIGGQKMRPDWIIGGMYLNIQFRNLTFVTQPLVHARLEGIGRESGEPYHYDVF